MADSIEAKLQALGLELPPAANPVANYVPSLIAGEFLYVSGQLARTGDGQVTKGRLGGELTVDAGQQAAKLCALNVLAQAKAALGHLDRVKQLVRVTGFVAAAPDFVDHPAVMNGASDLFVAVLGDRGRHTRAAVGVASLPAGSAVEVDAIFWIAPA